MGKLAVLMFVSIAAAFGQNVMTSARSRNVFIEAASKAPPEFILGWSTPVDLALVPYRFLRHRPLELKTWWFNIGSGFAVNSNYVLTDTHVISDESDIKVNGQSARVAASCPELDITLLETDAKMKVSEARMADTLPPSGVQVFTIGNPNGKRNRVTFGKVLKTLYDHRLINGLLVMTNAKTDLGNSGGAFYDSHGTIVGMAEAKTSGRWREGKSMSYFIPSRDIRSCLQQQGFGFLLQEP